MVDHVERHILADRKTLPPAKAVIKNYLLTILGLLFDTQTLKALLQEATSNRMPSQAKLSQGAEWHRQLGVTWLVKLIWGRKLGFCQWRIYCITHIAGARNPAVLGAPKFIIKILKYFNFKGEYICKL